MDLTFILLLIAIIYLSEKKVDTKVLIGLSLGGLALIGLSRREEGVGEESCDTPASASPYCPQDGCDYQTGSASCIATNTEDDDACTAANADSTACEAVIKSSDQACTWDATGTGTGTCTATDETNVDDVAACTASTASTDSTACEAVPNSSSQACTYTAPSSPTCTGTPTPSPDFMSKLKKYQYYVGGGVALLFILILVISMGGSGSRSSAPVIIMRSK